MSDKHQTSDYRFGGKTFKIYDNDSNIYFFLTETYTKKVGSESWFIILLA